MRHYNRYSSRPWRGTTLTTASSLKSTLTLMIPPLLIAFPLSIAIFAVEEIVITILRAHSDNGVLELPYPYNVKTFDIDTMPTSFIIGTSIVTGLLSCLAALGFWELRNRDLSSRGDRHDRLWAWVNLSTTLGNLALVVGCLATVFLAEQRDKPLVFTGMWSTERQTATRETWLCSIRDKVKSSHWNGDWARVGCGFALTGRWMLVPLAVVSAAQVVLCLWQIMQRGGMDWLLRRTSIQGGKGRGLDLN